MLAREIVDFIYGFALPEWKIQLASELLVFSAMTVLLFTVVQATSSILQGLRKQRIPMYTMMAGVAVKILLNYILIGTPGIHIHGGPYAFYVCKYAKMSFRWIPWVVRPGAAAAVMGAVVWLMKRFLPSGRMVTILMIIVGIAAYFAVAMAVGALTKDDLRAMTRRNRRKS